MLRLLLIDDNPVFLTALDNVLSQVPEVRVIGRADYAPEGLRLAIEMQPDLVLADMTMPDLTGIDIARRLGEMQPKTAVAVISMHDGVDYQRAAHAAGAIAFIHKYNLLDALPALIDEVEARIRSATGSAKAAP